MLFMPLARGQACVPISAFSLATTVNSVKKYFQFEISGPLKTLISKAELYEAIFCFFCWNFQFWGTVLLGRNRSIIKKILH